MTKIPIFNYFATKFYLKLSGFDQYFGFGRKLFSTMQKELLEITKKVPYCGLDCEWEPERYRGVKNKTAMLQVAVYDNDRSISKSYLFRLLNCCMKNPYLLQFLNSTNVLKLGVGISVDFTRLVEEDYIKAENRHYFDLRSVFDL